VLVGQQSIAGIISLVELAAYSYVFVVGIGLIEALPDARTPFAGLRIKAHVPSRSQSSEIIEERPSRFDNEVRSMNQTQYERSVLPEECLKQGQLHATINTLYCFRIFL